MVGKFKKRVDNSTLLIYTIDTNKGREERKMFEVKARNNRT